MGNSPWGRKETDRTERLHFHFHFVGYLLLPFLCFLRLICPFQCSQPEGGSESSPKEAFVNAKALWLAMTGQHMLLPFYLMLWNQDTKCPAILRTASKCQQLAYSESSNY